MNAVSHGDDSFSRYHRALESLQKTVWNVNIHRKNTGTVRGKGIFAKTFIPTGQVIAVYRGVLIFFDCAHCATIRFLCHVVAVGDIVNGTTGQIIESNPFTDHLRSTHSELFKNVQFSREHACCLMGQPANFSVDGSYHCVDVDDEPNRLGFPWGSLLNSSQGCVVLTFPPCVCGGIVTHMQDSRWPQLQNDLVEICGYGLSSCFWWTVGKWS
jgi:hypothetical protein